MISGADVLIWIVWSVVISTVIGCCIGACAYKNENKTERNRIQKPRYHEKETGIDWSAVEARYRKYGITRYTTYLAADGMLHWKSSNRICMVKDSEGNCPKETQDCQRCSSYNSYDKVCQYQGEGFQSKKQPPIKLNENRELNKRFDDAKKRFDKYQKLMKGFHVDLTRHEETQEDRDWRYVEKINKAVSITRKNAYHDDKGYLRWKENDRLCHRDIAYKHCENNTGLPFSQCDVHHVDFFKLDNNPSNLEILDRKTHDKRHAARR